MLRKLLVTVVIIVAVLGLTFALGPREVVDETITFDPATIGEDIETYLAEREAEIPDITPGAEKQVIWHDAISKAKTQHAIVYIHGFSATLEEVRPLPDLVGADLDANIFYTRLKGHGRTGDAMADATVNDWYNDVAEAVAVGRKIGEKIIIVSTSTGGTLATWAATEPELMEDVAAMVFISPNFKVKAAGSEILELPWARQVLPLFLGKNRSFEARNAEQAKWWTTTYPNVALLPMQASVAATADIAMEDLDVPALFIFHPNDGVVDSAVTAKVAERWGKNNAVAVKVHQPADAEDEYKHVIAGRILSPANTEPLAELTTKWIKSL